jgi:hypothetical protein
MLHLEGKMTTGQTITVPIKKCSSCGEDHDWVKFNELISPAVVGTAVCPYIGQCPKTSQVIFLKEIDDAPGG